MMPPRNPKKIMRSFGNNSTSPAYIFDVSKRPGAYPGLLLYTPP